MEFSTYLKELRNAQKGLNKGIPFNLPRFEKYVPGLTRKTYYIIGGLTGSGKTSFMFDKFFCTPYEYCFTNKDTDIESIFFSFEMDKESLITKAMQRRIFLNYTETDSVGVKKPLELSYNYIHCRGSSTLSMKHFNCIQDQEDYWKYIEERTTWYTQSMSPKEIDNAISSFVAKQGKMVNGRYVQHDPSKHLVVYLDHLALVTPQQGKTTKSTMDDLSKLFIKYRNIYRLSIVVVQQLNYDIYNALRVKSGRLAPTLSDFGDSKATTRDANNVFVVHSPKAVGENWYKGYDITKLEDNFRSIEILKSRFGRNYISAPMLFKGKVGTFFEAPLPSDPKLDKIYKNLTTT